MRSTLLGSFLLAVSFGVVGCDDAKKDNVVPESAPVVTPPAGEAGKGAMDGPKAEMKPGGAMEGPAPVTAPAAEPATPPLTEPTPPAEKSGDMPK